MDEGMMDVVHTAAHYHTYKHRKTRSIEQEKSTVQAKRAKHVGLEDRLVGGLGFCWILDLSDSFRVSSSIQRDTLHCMLDVFVTLR
jgi:hypothetical protein